MSVVVQPAPEVNPLQDSLRFARRVPPCAIVIFGASGDLSKRKLLPSLYRLFYERRIPPNFAVIGSSRTPMSDEQFRDRMKESVSKFLEDAPFDADVWTSFAQLLFYVPGDLNDPASYDDLGNKLDEVEKSHQTGGNVLFYLSTQPSHYAEAILELGKHNLNHGNGWRRVIIEKPFGHDLESARKLNDEIHKVFNESEVYRIDHYLGKETVQNILAFRFGNSMFEPLVEPPLRESRADYGGRIDRRRRPRRLLPGSGRAARYDPESLEPGDGDGVDGAAGGVRRH